MGPSACVIFNELPSERQIKELETSLNVKKFSIDFGFVFPGESYWDYDEEELASIEKKTSMSVCGAFEISCPCNSSEDHRSLGEAILIASQQLYGLIDFNGAIYPPLPKEMYEGMWLWEKANWSDIEPFFSEMISDIPGNIFTIEYETANNRVWAHHICDSEFMNHWLKHPMFRMIK